jgi:hypothetical protein
MKAARKSLMRKLRWIASGGGLLLFLGLVVTIGNQAGGLVIALAGLIILVGVVYVAYGIGKAEVPSPSGES